MIFDSNTKDEQRLGHNNRVLILVRGGVAEVFADNPSQVFLLDYDNEPDSSVPDRFNDLLTLRR